MTAPADHLALARRRILIVEDEYFIADELARAVSRLGAAVVGPVPTVERALAEISSGDRIDAAVLDINLRDELAYVVAHALAELGIPFLFATGYDRIAIRTGYEQIPRLGKPFDADVLTHTLSGLVNDPADGQIASI